MRAASDNKRGTIPMSPSPALSGGALEGVRVLDFSAMIAGPYCTRLMADVGAEVIKVEPPEGDFMRGRPPLRDGHSVYFGVLNCGKKSLAVDLKHPEGVALVKALVARADVVIENFRPGVMQRLGLEAALLRAINPRLVYCAISGYGQNGASSRLPGYAPIVQAASGYEVANLEYQGGGDKPLKSAMFVADYLTGVHAFGAINAALLRAARTGQGDSIDCALMDAMVGMLAYEVAVAQQPVHQPRPVYQPVRALDGHLMFAPISQGNFEDMARAMGRADWLVDDRFAKSLARAGNWDALMAEVEQWTRGRTCAECLAIMNEQGVPCARYQSVGDVVASTYAAERGLFTRASDAAGEFLATNPPFVMRGSGTRARVPELGESGAAVLKEWLHRSDDQIRSLVDAGALAGTFSA
jgi:crotonobetainyl-CoA:carnitine CoA-transferase CaiB-like acyl-CoA transferase